MKTPIKLKESNKIIGYKDYDTNTFSKEVSGKKHLFRVGDAWGLDCKLHESLLPDNWKIEILDTDDNKLYKTDAQTYKDKGFFYHFKGGEDYRPQIFLSRREFVVK